MGGGRTYSFSGSNFKNFSFQNPENIFANFAKQEGGFDDFDFGGFGSAFGAGSPLGNRGSHSHGGFPGQRFGSSREGNGRSKTPESTVVEKHIGFTLEE